MAKLNSKPRLLTPGERAAINKARQRPITKLTHARNARLEMFARLWVGNIEQTIELCKAEGISVCYNTAATYLRDHRFIDVMRAQKAEAPGTGIWTVEELKRFYTRVAAGIEPDGFTLVLLKEPIIPGEDDYDEAKGGQQWRTIEKRAPFYPGLAIRKSAADSLGKTLGANVDKLELTGDLRVTVTDLLDDDLRHAKPVQDARAQVVDKRAQVLELADESEIDVSALLA